MPGLFDPWSIGSLSLKNRVVVSPMCQYQAQETGNVTDWHLVHYGSMALGGAALMIIEATAVLAQGRISVHDVGLYAPEHESGLRKIVDFAHLQGTKIGVQLAHAGRKADIPGPIVAPSEIAFSNRYAVPQALDREGLKAIREAFVKAAQRAVDAGFDFIELHAAHGYLLHEFISPLSNQRTDEYGGNEQGRLRFVLEVIDAMVEAVAHKIPVGIRVSATEYHPQGYNERQMTDYCKEFIRHGITVLDVSSGGNVPLVPEVYPGYQVGFANMIKQAVSVPVIAVGMLDDPKLAEYVVRSGQADAVAIGRGFLRDKHFAHTAAKSLGYEVEVPKSYERAYR
ncbi:NADH:flavin oxidoreductase/NADH oxidase [Sulfoacidibacillus thermotolerans]|uniref:NADPH dehydrogenase n=1 Tax=Sulfoacidibacillus thermotolerans TaxID=1765684 RepID=A0A2U3D8V7_SULT2|nr:NADH:flavin oxidoreductase/NADH oxidase [Sulfoacidibacillus thermotolerans]PWI57712.1 NADPH dehydrogenase [Sulfoacidibacillus thermotolerans]